MILKEFLKQKDFGNLLISVEHFKPHLLDYTNITKLMYETYDLNNELGKNSLFFKTIQRMAEYTDNKMGLFLIFIKSKSLRAFDIIKDPGNVSLPKSNLDIEIDLASEQNFIVELISISPIRAVDYFLYLNKKNGENVIERVVEFLK
jgi:hypothetical protein